MFTTALANLAALTVDGVKHNFAINTVPEELNRAHLPALLVMPLSPQNQAFPERGGEGYTASAFGEGTHTITYPVTHLLLVAPETSSTRFNLPQLADLIQSYFETINDSLTLDGALTQPTQIKVEPGRYEYGQTTYYGCAFRHLWLMEV